jgi:electron transport complex protein RnfD
VSPTPTPAPRQFVVTPGPHLHVGDSTARIMWWVNLALAPAAVWGAVAFGVAALLVMVGSIAGALAAEWLGTRMLKRRSTLRDGSAFCTGLLLAMTLPPLLPWWAAFLGAAFAILVAKTMFGGLGFNLFNPALIGRAFLMATFPVVMTTGWVAPRPLVMNTLDAVTTPTPLAALKEGGPEAVAALIAAPADWSGLVLGLHPGSIGEVSAVLVLVGAAVLVMRGIITLTIPLAVFAGMFAVTAFSGAVWFHLMSGGLWLGAFFMATDYVTSPNTRNGQIVFGLAIGALTGVIRLWGGYPEGICYAILIANLMVPAFNLWFRPRRLAPTGAPS